MNLILRRKEFRFDGIFGELYDQYNNFIMVTLEHAYPQTDGSFAPKVAKGQYICVRHAPNRLPYETFMLSDVPPFEGKEVTGILIHILNYNDESDGCIGVGMQIGNKSDGGKMIMQSKLAFESLMKYQDSINEFTIMIE